MNTMDKLIEIEKQIEKGLTNEELTELIKKVHKIKTELYSEEWYKKMNILTCITEFLED